MSRLLKPGSNERCLPGGGLERAHLARLRATFVASVRRAGKMPALLTLVAALCLAIRMMSAGGSAAGAEPRIPPQAQKIGEDLYRLGKLTVNLKTKTASCAGKVNMNRGAIEYLAVAPRGKRHESVLVLDVRPLHLQLGLILLDLEPKGGLEAGPGRDPAKGAPKGSPVELYAAWQRSGHPVKVHAEELAWDMDRRRPMDPHPWVFSGSGVDENGFIADRELSLIAVFRDYTAVINNALPTGTSDTVYKVNERVVPPVGTPVTFTVTPASGHA